MSEKCPYSGHEIPDGATVCVCGAEKVFGPLASERKRMGFIGWLAGIVIGGMVGGGLGAVIGCLVGTLAGMMSASSIYRNPRWVRLMHR